MDKLKRYFEHQGFGAGDIDRILSAFHLRIFKKCELLTASGDEEAVENGMFAYYFPDETAETNPLLADGQDFPPSPFGFFREAPAQENIRALISGRVWMIHPGDIEILVREIPAFRDFYIRLLEMHIRAIDNCRNDLLRLSADERYGKMLRETPQMLEHIPLQYIAAVLGVTPRHLSRIRRNFT